MLSMFSLGGGAGGASRPFNGGLFVNGGFEDGIASWKLYPTNGSWTATPGEDTAENIPNTVGTHFYQDFTLVAGESYMLSADQISGDGTVTYCINTADSGIAIADGPTVFVGTSAPESIGVTMSIAGTTPAVVDNLRLMRIPDPVVDFTATPDPLLIEYVPIVNGVTYEGSMVEYNNEVVTYVP